MRSHRAENSSTHCRYCGSHPSQWHQPCQMEADTASGNERQPSWLETTRRTVEQHTRGSGGWWVDAAYGLLDEVDALAVRVGELEAENARLRAHGAGLPMPSRERIDAMHSRLPAGWFDNQLHASHGGHPLYGQGPEQCYFCVLLGGLEAAEAEVVTLRDALREIADGAGYAAETRRDQGW